LNNDNQGAVTDWERSMSLKPNYGAYLNLGTYKVISGNNDRGLVDIETAIKLDPKLSNAYIVRGFIRGAAGDKQGSRSDYRQALKLDPKIIDEWTRYTKELQKSNNIAAYEKFQQMLQGLTSQKNRDP
jgi:tetratricopeptide (TPR) repeat protein